jgi:hypothetical protein
MIIYGEPQRVETRNFDLFKYNLPSCPRRNFYIAEQLKADRVEKKLAHWKQKWLNHFRRMEHFRHPEQLLGCGPVGRRNP